MLHTIQEAMKLAGVSRRTLYNHMDSGRVSATPGVDGRRYLETSELERAYGKLKPVAHPDAQQSAHSFTPPSDNGELAKLIEDSVQRATAPLVAEIAELRATLMRIEHKPDTPATAPAAPQADPPTVPTPAPVATGSQQHSHSPAVASFADLLSNWE